MTEDFICRVLRVVGRWAERPRGPVWLHNWSFNAYEDHMARRRRREHNKRARTRWAWTPREPSVSERLRAAGWTLDLDGLWRKPGGYDGTAPMGLDEARAYLDRCGSDR